MPHLLRGPGQVLAAPRNEVLRGWAMPRLGGASGPQGRRSRNEVLRGWAMPPGSATRRTLIVVPRNGVSWDGRCHFCSPRTMSAVTPLATKFSGMSDATSALRTRSTMESSSQRTFSGDGRCHRKPKLYCCGAGPRLAAVFRGAPMPLMWNSRMAKPPRITECFRREADVTRTGGRRAEFRGRAMPQACETCDLNKQEMSPSVSLSQPSQRSFQGKGDATVRAIFRGKGRCHSLC